MTYSQDYFVEIINSIISSLDFLSWLQRVFLKMYVVFYNQFVFYICFHWFTDLLYLTMIQSSRHL